MREEYSMAIKGIHAMFYTPMAEETRAFLRDKLDFPYYETRFRLPDGQQIDLFQPKH
jgi:hypothetical protein